MLDYIYDLFATVDFTGKQEEEVIGCTGPGALTRFYLNNRERYPEIRYTPKDVFHPLIVNHALGIKKTAETIGAHYCFGSWRGKSHAPLRKPIYALIQHIQARGLNVLNF